VGVGDDQLHAGLPSRAREEEDFFNDGVERMALDLVDATVIRPGVAILTYQSRR
jgi:hypothetical protein